MRRKLVLERRGLYCDVGLDGSAVVGSVERVELVGYEGEGGVDGQFHDGYCSCFYQFNLGDALMRGKYFLEFFKRNSNFLAIRDKFHPSKDRFVNGDVNIAIFDGYSVGAASKKFDGNCVELQQKLYPFKGDNSSLEILIGLFRNDIGHFEKLLC